MSRFEGTHEKVDRRRSPRFHCGGQVTIHSLPSNGAAVIGRIRNLSSGGLCIESSHPMDAGTRIEILVCVNAASFRAVGLVKGIERASITRLEFLQMSASSKQVLAELLAHLVKVQIAMKTLRSARNDIQSELLDGTSQESGARLAMLGVLTASAKTGGNCAEPDSTEPDLHGLSEASKQEELPLLMKIDLFC